LCGGRSPATLAMSKPPKSEGNQPLQGVRVLVGRARHQAGALSAELRKLGAQVLEIPFIEIRKPRSFQPLDSALKNINTYDWLILTSVNGVEAMVARLEKQRLSFANLKSKRADLKAKGNRADHDFSRAVKGRQGHELTGAAKGDGRNAALAAGGIRIAAIGPATRKAIEQRGAKVDVVPKEYVAESVVRSLKAKVKGKRALLVRAKVARDVIPRELRKAGAHVDVVEAYETVVPASSRARLRTAFKNAGRRPHVVTFTSSSTVKNFAALLDRRKEVPFAATLTASIGPVTSATLRELGFPVDIAAKEFTIPGLVAAIADVFRDDGQKPLLNRRR
jgi:uroporphyrinogen-III synthase